MKKTTCLLVIVLFTLISTGAFCQTNKSPNSYFNYGNWSTNTSDNNIGAFSKNSSYIVDRKFNSENLSTNISASESFKFSNKYDYKNTITGSDTKVNYSISESEIFPNPATSIVTILNQENKSTIQLFDAYGKKVLEINDINMNKQTISLSELNAGNYYLRINIKLETKSYKLVKI